MRSHGMVPRISKALIIRFSSVGDIVLSSLLVRVFRRRFPDCKLDFAVKQRYADLVRHNPNIDDVITFPDKGTWAELLETRRRIRTARYDLIIDIHDSIRSRVITFGSDRTVRIRKRKLARFFLVRTGINLYSSLGGSPGVAQRYLETVRSLGVLDDGEGLEFHYTGEDKARAESLLQQSKSTYVGLAPGSIHGNKMWLPDRFAQTALVLARERNAGIILFGSAREKERCDEIGSRLHHHDPGIPVFNTAGQTTLPEAAALMDSCCIVITNDSGLMHLACARKRPVVAVFGPTVKEFGFFPDGRGARVVEHTSLSCRPCTHVGLPECPKGHFRCMTEIGTEPVLRAARELLSA